MLRILEPGRIEAFAQRAIPRLQLPDRAQVFSQRARRLRKLGDSGAIGHAIGEYLRLMAALADAQQASLASFKATAPDAGQIAHARAFGLPPLHVMSRPRDKHWRDLLQALCDSMAALPDLPASARDVCNRVRHCEPAWIEQQADVLLAARTTEVDIALAPFLMAALQVCWVDLASQLTCDDAAEVDVQGVCPMCGTLPVASVVRTNQRSQGHRYLHCALCATEWHMVRVTCSQCQSTRGITYQSIEGGPDAIRAECCEECRSYRKIFYQEKDPEVEPVADDLASLALDLLLGEAGYRRSSGNPLLWQA